MTYPVRRHIPFLLDVLVLLLALAALYGCMVVLPSALDDTIVYKGF